MDDQELLRGEITRYLSQAAQGDRAAQGRVWSSLYGELRRLASRKLRGEAEGHTLSTTDLVHEAYVKLVDGEPRSVVDRHHFLALAARAMRQILVDHARRRSRLKRAGSRASVTLDESRILLLHPEEDPETLLALDQALTLLGSANERLAEVVELRFFGGLATHETAEILGVTRRTVERDWTRARAYLYRHMVGGVEAPAQ